MYSVKEIFFTLQGEGANTGRSSVFCRFSGCNLWSGLERDRARAVCDFCDTDFVGTDGEGGGPFYEANDLAQTVGEIWERDGEQTNGGNVSSRRFVVLTGGEPMLQVDDELIDALHAQGFEIAIETNGTLPVPRSIDWICVSPKSGAPIVQTSGEELKLVYPQDGLEPEAMEHMDFRHRFLQPMDGADLSANTTKAIAYCRRHPGWQLSLQTHKLLGIR